MPKPPRKHGKIEESEIDELAKVEAMLEFKRIEGCSLAKHRSIALANSGLTKQLESVLRKIWSREDFKAKVEREMEIFPLTGLPCWSLENEDLCDVRSVSLRTEAASMQAETWITDLEVFLRQGRQEEIIKSIDPGVYSEENMKVVNQAFTEFMAGCTFGANVNAHSVAIIIKIWQTLWQLSGNHNQNVPNMLTEWIS